jgi:hypothetical protein
LPNSFVPSPIYSSTSLIPFWSSQEPYSPPPIPNKLCLRSFSPTIFIGVVFSPNVPQKCKL